MCWTEYSYMTNFYCIFYEDCRKKIQLYNKNISWSYLWKNKLFPLCVNVNEIINAEGHNLRLQLLNIWGEQKWYYLHTFDCCTYKSKFQKKNFSPVYPMTDLLMHLLVTFCLFFVCFCLLIPSMHCDVVREDF